jgi:glycosyltransferase involved in cell wall biosynthesis
MTQTGGQGKVSIVMPCYNKEEYISVTFDTILAQVWDNIELVLVNDGSTDRTREIIGAYEPKFKQRGYEVTIIDQDNGGVIAAAKAGLERASGDYVCQVDADDELDPEYVSAMATWLDGAPDRDIAICSAVNFRDTDEGREFYHLPTERRPKESDNEIGPEHFFLGEIIRQTVWIYMARTSYIRSCGILRTYDTGMRGSHEPGYIVPLLAGKGQRKFIPRPLYLFNGTGDGYSRSDSMEHYQRYYDTYNELSKRAIEALPEDTATPEQKRFWMNCCRLSSAMRLYRLSAQLKATDDTTERYAKKLLDTVNKAFQAEHPITQDRTKGQEIQLTIIIEDCIFERMTPESSKEYPELIRERLFEEDANEATTG